FSVEFCGGEKDERELLKIGEVGVVLFGGGEEEDMRILRRSEGFRREDERMAGPKENRVKVAEKEETGKFRGSSNGESRDESSEEEHSSSHGMERIEAND
ncbi:hypothetical protein Tco_1399634, partial [Tanacetum coccineum]